MSMIEHTATSTLGKIFIGRRILELMQEKGNAYSIRAFADRLGINRETFRTTLTGDRPISLSLVEKIAEGLHVTEERLRQLDTFKKEGELVALLTANNRTKVMLMRASSIAQELVEVALGDTERGFAYNNLGRTQFLQQEYEDAHESWKKALVYARKIQKSFADTQLLGIVSANFMMTCARIKDYGGADEMLQLVEQSFSDDYETLGMVAYSRMVMYGERGKLEQARKYAYQSLEHFTKTNNKKQIGYGYLNVANAEYKLGNYDGSVQVLDSAFGVVQDFDQMIAFVVKDYVRSLIKLREYERATKIAEKYETITKQFPECWNKIQIMYSVLKGDPKYADNIVNDLQASVKVRTLACKCLFEYYAKRGDSELALR